MEEKNSVHVKLSLPVPQLIGLSLGRSADSRVYLLDLSSFLWKMLLDLLCTQERLHKMGASPSPLCKLCKQETGTLKHELLECSFNENIGQLLLLTIQNQLPSMTPESLLHLGLSNIDADMELPTTLLAAVTLS